MPEFKVILIISNNNHQEVPYAVNLAGVYEDYPEDYFRIEENRLKMQAALQERAGRKVSKYQIKPIIDKWIGEIKEGKRRTTIRIDLPQEPPEVIPDPPMAKSTPADIVTSKYQIFIPNYPSPVAPQPITANNTNNPETRQPISAITSTLAQEFHPKTQIGANVNNPPPPKPQEVENPPPQPKLEEKTSPEYWSNGNRFDDF